jgi:hypothetical protein
MTRLAWLAAFPAAAITLAACSGSPAPAAGTSSTPPKSAAASSPAGASSPAAEPDTAAGARTAAETYFALYSAGQWAATYALLAPSASSQVSESAWVDVHEGCPSAAAGLAYQVGKPVMVGNTAVMPVSIAGALSKLATVEETFTYSGGQWRWQPSGSGAAVYTHGSVTADIAAAKAAGYCSG